MSLTTVIFFFFQLALKNVSKNSRKWCSVIAIESFSKELGIWEGPRGLVRSSLLPRGSYVERGGAGRMTWLYTWHMHQSRGFFPLYLFLLPSLPPSFCLSSPFLKTFSKLLLLFFAFRTCVNDCTFTHYSRYISET